MFRSKLRRASISDFLTVTTQDENTTIYNETSMDIGLDELHKPNEHPPKPTKLKALKRHYKLLDLVIFSICNTVGSGIYVLAGAAGKNISGAGLLVSMIFGLFSSGLSALCYAEFSSRYPIIGSTYSYTYISTGEAAAFVVGLLGCVNSFCASSIVAIAAAGYARSFLETLSTDFELENTIWFGIQISGVVSINIIAPLFILILTLIILFDIKLGSAAMNVGTIVNIFLLILFTIACFFMFNGNYITNPCDYNQVYTNESCPDDVQNSWIPYGFSGIAQASPIAFWAFTGCEEVALMAEESVNPTRDIPLALYITLGFVFVLYELILLGLFGMVPFFSLDETAPLSEAFGVHNEQMLQRICAFGACSTLCLVLFASLTGSPRLLYRMSLDGLLPSILRYVHHKTRTPFAAVGVYGLLALCIAMFFDLSDVLNFSSTSILINLSIIALGTLLARYCPPSLEKIYKNNIDMVVMNKDIQLTPFWTDMRIFKFLWSFFLAAFFEAFVAVNYDYFNDNNLFILWILIVAILGIIILGQCMIIIYLDKTLPWKDWIISNDIKLENLMFVPLSPYSQCMLIIFNCYMIASAGIIYFLQWLGCVTVGIIIYNFYGYKHSNMNPIRQSLL